MNPDPNPTPPRSRPRPGRFVPHPPLARRFARRSSPETAGDPLECLRLPSVRSARPETTDRELSLLHELELARSLRQALELALALRWEDVPLPPPPPSLRPGRWRRRAQRTIDRALRDRRMSCPGEVDSPDSPVAHDSPGARLRLLTRLVATRASDWPDLPALLRAAGPGPPPGKRGQLVLAAASLACGRDAEARDGFARLLRCPSPPQLRARARGGPRFEPQCTAWLGLALAHFASGNRWAARQAIEGLRRFEGSAPFEARALSLGIAWGDRRRRSPESDVVADLARLRRRFDHDFGRARARVRTGLARLGPFLAKSVGVDPDRIPARDEDRPSQRLLRFLGLSPVS